MIARRLLLAIAGALLLARPVAAADVVRLPTLVTDGVPRGLVTMVVPIPAELANEPEVTYEVRLLDDVEILGRLRGPARVAGAPARPLVLTLRVPAAADAGTIDVAEVVFRDRAGREYVVPLQLRVSVVRSLTIMGTRELRGLRAGDRLELPFRVVNAGNATDSVRLVVRGPTGWGTRLDRPALATVAPRGQLEFTVSVGIPAVANLGDHTLSVALQVPGVAEPVSIAYTTLGITGRAGQVAGLVMRPTIAVASTSTGTASFTGVELAGPVSPGVSVRAQLTPAIDRGGMTSQGLASVGALSAPFSAAVYGADWDVSAGNTALQLSDLTGVNVIGRGVTGRIQRDDVEARAIVAAPASGTREVNGELLGLGYWRGTGAGRLGGSFSYLREQGGLANGRELRAVAADYRTPRIGTLTVGASLGHRTTGLAHGVGYGVTVQHDRPRERAVFRLAHAPGGTAGFARAEDEWQLDASRALTPRWFVDGSAQRSRDRGNVFAGMRAQSWTMGQRYAVRPDLSVSARFAENDFTVTTEDAGIGDFGARDRQVSGGLEWRRGLLAVSAEGSRGHITRSTELVDGRIDEQVAAQQGLRLSASRAFERWGAVDVNGSVEQTAAGVGLPGVIRTAGLRWSDLPLTYGTRQATLSTEASLQQMGNLKAMVVTRAVLRAALPGGLDLAVSAERNPFFRDRTGHAGWIGAIRLTAATRVYSPGALGPEGLVFEDRDRDGQYDPMEPGVPGVTVRRGDSKAVTDRNGRYRLPVQARGRSRIDQGSLPKGLVAHPALAGDSVERLDLPVLPTGSVSVEMQLAADETGRVPEVSLEAAVVLLRDETGFEWVGRRTGPNTAIFDGVPVGKYTLAFNFNRVREPLRADESAVTVTPHQTARLTVPVRGRAIRIFTPPARQQRGTRQGTTQGTVQGPAR